MFIKSHFVFPSFLGKLPVSVLMMAPAVTPMNSSLPGVGPNNPGIRLYFYRRTTGEIVNYHQYYLNLRKIHPVSNSAKWELEYRALEDVLVTDMTPQSFDRYVKEFSKNEMAKFRKYLRHNTVSYGEESTRKPDAREFQEHVCAIKHLSTDSYQACINQTPNAYLLLHSPEGLQSKNKGPELPIYTYYVVTAFAALTFLVLVVMSVVRKQCTRTPSLPFRYRPLTNDCQYVQRERATWFAKILMFFGGWGGEWREMLPWFISGVFTLILSQRCSLHFDCQIFGLQ